MRFKRIITAVDSHTEGEPARVVTGGIPYVPGATMKEKWAWAKENLDDLRTMLMFEPRGSNVMSGSIITPPCSPEADLGIIFIEVSGFLPMCGHGTIAACTVLIETGIIPAKEPYTDFTLDTPAGLVRAHVRVENGAAMDVTIQNVPAFLYKRDLQLNVPEVGRIRFDIAWGGNFYAIVPVESVGLDISPACVRPLIDTGNKIRDIIFNEGIEVVHPLRPDIRHCSHVRFVGKPKNPIATTQNAVLYSAEAIDRSPCGTGTSAEMAYRHATGKLEIGQEFISESIIGSLFHGRLIEETQIGPFHAVIPTIRGRGFISGIQQFVLDERDPWPNGFYLGAKSRWGAGF